MADWLLLNTLYFSPINHLGFTKSVQRGVCHHEASVAYGRLRCSLDTHLPCCNRLDTFVLPLLSSPVTSTVSPSKFQDGVTENVVVHLSWGTQLAASKHHRPRQRTLVSQKPDKTEDTNIPTAITETHKKKLPGNTISRYLNSSSKQK